MKKKVIIFILISFIIVIVALFLYVNKTEPSISLKKYFDCLNNKNYESMYDYVITEVPKEEFITRIKNIYDGISATNIKVAVLTNYTEENNEDVVNVTYNNSMNTSAGNTNFINTVKLKKIGEEYKILWDSSVIFPDLKDEYKVKVMELKSTRGTIYDKNNISLAKDGEVYSVGLVPSKIDNTTNLNRISELLGIRKETIENSLNASYVKDDTFVPLKNISKEEQELKNQLLEIKGILITDTNLRIYPYKGATSILTGYIQDGEGKTGLEYAYNDRLKGTNGEEIYIVDEDGNKVKTLIKKDLKNGENVKTTIDVSLQKELYEQFKDTEGAHIAMNYNTGEILALVSTPSYDANRIVLGLTDDEWNKLQSDENRPMYNRYLSTYVPGSSLKPIIGAIGLKYNSFNSDDDFGKSGAKWQNDSSWKDLYVTTLITYDEPANLRNALIHSDNIYFAKAALKIGKKNLENGLDEFGFNDKISFIQDISKSTYGMMNSDSSIANSGYGQDEMLVNPIHMAMIYSSFANGGNMVMPCLEYDETKYYKQNIISSEIANIIKEDLVQVVEQGTGKEAKVMGKTIAGKTGTAEIKENQQDENGTEIGWFNSFDENGLLIISMVQNAKELGGSHYLLPKIKDIYELQN